MSAECRPFATFADARLEVATVVAGPLRTNVYVVTSRPAGITVIVDPADDPEAILAECRELDVTAIVITHGHWDHVGAAQQVASALAVDVLIHPADADLSGIPNTRPLHDGATIAGLPLVARHTPGHTPGSTCLSGAGVLLSGDTLFPGGPGKTADPVAFATIMRSLRKTLFTLPDATVVLPGHGASTTLGAERGHLDEWESRGW